ncbi:hypothetical protein EK21DRAFT_106072 [Setomelanomma holmii]|uniref:Uncharacterized protein n=1 Tax=Setomelanomma holmii TaxID=210430 RepID=A0A9P4HK53_9PLEO|nr:hypothetical protein EK21DRAFT_106072 [Setomelanomma holmii]
MTLTQHFCVSTAFTSTVYPTILSNSDVRSAASSAPTQTSSRPALSTASSIPEPSGGKMPTDFTAGAAAGGAVGGALIVSLLGWWGHAKRKAKKRRSLLTMGSNEAVTIEPKTSGRISVR